MKMAFINPLGPMLTIYAIATLTGFIYLLIWFLKGEDYVESMRENMGILYMILGSVALIYALYMALTWPIPEIPGGFPLYVYNMQFGEPYLWFSIITLFTGLSLYRKFDLKPISYLAFFAGIFLLRYAYNFLEFGLTREPTIAFTIYFTAAIGAIISPLWTHLGGSYKRYFSFILAIFLLISGASAGFIGFEAAYGHIGEPIKEFLAGAG